MSIPLENLRRDQRARLESDQLLTTAWILVPLLEVLTVIVFIIVIVVSVIDYIRAQLTGAIDPAGFFTSPLFLGAIVAVSFIIFLLSLFFAYMLYKLVKRRNAHFGRQLLLYEDLTSLASDLAAKKNIDVAVSLNNLKRLQREAWIEENEKNAVLWSGLTLAATTLGAFVDIQGGGGGGSLLPTIAILYVFYFLMKDFFNHERREDIFFQELGRIFAAAGVTANLPGRVSPIPSRNFILYVVLTILTVGFFGVYWVYVLVSDPNTHLRLQAATEDSIIAQVTPLMA